MPGLTSAISGSGGSSWSTVAGNKIVNGTMIINNQTASLIPLTARGANGQTANLFELKNILNTVVYSVDVSGNVTFLGDEYITDALTVNGNTQMNGTLAVDGISTFNAALAVTAGGVTIAGESSFTNKLTVNSLYSEGDITCQTGYFKTNYGSDLYLVPSSGGINVVGATNSNTHSLVDSDDLFVGGSLEITSTAFFEGNVVLKHNTYLTGASSPTTYGGIILRNSSQTINTTTLGVGTTSRILQIIEFGDITIDLGHAQQTNPTIFLHSADVTDTTQWFSMAHDQTNAILESGKGDIEFKSSIYAGVMEFADDAGAVTAMDFSVTATPTAGEEMSIAFAIDHEWFLKLYSEADSAGATQNEEVRIYKDTEVFGKTTQTDPWFYDEFWTATGTSWVTRTTTGAVAYQGTADGIVRLTTGGVITNEESLDWNDMFGFVNTQHPEFRVRLQLEQTATTEVYIGLVGTNASDYVWLQYDASADGNWHLITSKNGAATNDDSGIAASTSVVEFKIKFTGDEALEWFVSYTDGKSWISQGTISTAANIPTAALQPVIMIKTEDGNARYFDLDYYKITQTRA